jgi:hypothetical protein
MVNLSKLSPVAQALNQKSNEVNAVISKINAKLLALNLGFEVWLRLDDTGLRFAKDDEASPATKYRQRDLLGYAQCGKDWTWQLVARREKTTYEFNQEEGQEETVREIEFTTPLLSASRESRIKAIQNMDAFLSMLKQQAECIIESINQAEAAAENL